MFFFFKNLIISTKKSLHQLFLDCVAGLEFAFVYLKNEMKLMGKKTKDNKKQNYLELILCENVKRLEKAVNWW